MLEVYSEGGGGQNSCVDKPAVSNRILLFIVQVALEYVKKYGVHKMRLLTFEKNRGKGGAVRLVRSFVSKQGDVTWDNF